MFSWLTGSKLVDDDGYGVAGAGIDDTRLEPPETPAPVFAVRAFKHAIFGTPAPPPTVATMKLTKKRKDPEKLDTTDIFAAKGGSDNTGLNFSPTKQGILLTPGTVRGKKKEVTFGAHVMDNEGKKISRSGIPNDCPGKFPSPWTPKVADSELISKPRTKLTEALYEAKATGTTPGHKGRARDDADLTLDIMEPRSESGRHWKEQYMACSRSSEEQIRKLTAKYKLCKEHARMKDDEAKELQRQLETGSKRRKTREQELEKQVKELREELRKAKAENHSASLEVALLRKQLDDRANCDARCTNAVEHKKPSVPSLLTNDSIWVDEAELTLETKDQTSTYLQAAIARTRGEQARTHRQRERRLARKQGSVTRQDSVVTPDDKHNWLDLELDRSPTPQVRRSVASKPARTILGEKSINIASSPPAPDLFSPSDFDRNTRKKLQLRTDVAVSRTPPKMPSPTHREAMAEAAASLSNLPNFSTIEDLAPMSALSLQAEQPITPPVARDDKTRIDGETLGRSARKHKRSEATTAGFIKPAGLDDARQLAAKARLEARRAKRLGKVN